MASLYGLDEHYSEAIPRYIRHPNDYAMDYLLANFNQYAVWDLA